MAKTIDRISAFLSNPEVRLKYYNDQQVEVLLKKDINYFAEKTKFKGRVVGVPRLDENASFNPFQTANRSFVEEMVFVRLDDIDEYFMPDPAYAGLDGDAIINLVLSHPLAVVDETVQQNSVRLGERVMCEFTQNPGNQGRQRGLRVVKLLDSPDAEDWRQAMSAQLLQNGLGELASAFASGETQPLGETGGDPGVQDFLGNYGAASHQVKVFLDDLVQRIRDAQKYYLLPIYVGSLFRSFRDQAIVMYQNVVDGKQAEKMGWYNTTYGPQEFDFAGVTSSNYAEYSSKIKKHMYHVVKQYLKRAQDGELDRDTTIDLITKTYKKYSDDYDVVPSKHCRSSAVDIRTIDWRREDKDLPPYTNDQKLELLSMSKPKSEEPKLGSDYSTFAGLESFPNKPGEHLHVNVITNTKEE